MRRVPASDSRPIRLSPKLRGRLKSWLRTRHDRATSAFAGIHTVWRTALRMYQGTPADRRWTPFANAPYVEVTIGALCADGVYAQAIDLIFQVKPPVTVRSRKDESDKAAEAFQDYLDWGVEARGGFNFRAAVKESILDDVQLGSFIYYVPWVRTIRKTDVNQVTDFGPKIYSLAPEHFLVPPNCGSDIQAAEFCTMIVMMTPDEARQAGAEQGWRLDDPNSVTTDDDPVMADRRRTAGINQDDSDNRPLKIGYTWAFCDVDDDGIAEDVEIVWNMTTGEPLKLGWNRYDYRPFVLGCFQDRAHLPFGIGVMEMVASFEEEITEIHNNRVWNMMMRNQMMFQGPEQAMGEVEELYAGKYIPNDAGKIEVMPMGEADNTPVQAEMMTESLAQRRVGINELNAASRLGGRTPGITALSALQQANRRFTPAFDNMRHGVAEAVMQCLYRLQEQVRAIDAGKLDDSEVIKDLRKILGDEKASLIIEMLRKDEMELSDAFDIQLTASSVSVNREADRQNMVMLSQLWEKYVQMMTAFATAKANPPFHGADKEAEIAAAALNKLMRKILKTFDQISDVDGFLIDLDAIPAGTVMPPALAQMVGAQNQPPPQNGVAPNGSEVA